MQTIKKRLHFFKGYIPWVILLYIAMFCLSIYLNLTAEPSFYITDNSRLSKVKIEKIVTVREEADVLQAIVEAKEKGLNISISGARHSQGGQSFCQHCIVLDMTQYNQVLALDQAHKVITVQSGATWEQIQEYINPHGLAVRVMQSSNIFTVGGSLSSNIHGRDPREGPIIETIRSFRLMTADGEILDVSREQHEELFRLAIGGFGLFGVILDVDIMLTENNLYLETFTAMEAEAFPDYVKHELLTNPDIHLTFGRLSVAPSSFLQKMYVQNYVRVNQPLTQEYIQLAGEKDVETHKFIFGLSRKFAWGKELSWMLQEKVFEADYPVFLSRNNAMRPGIRFLEYHPSKRTDILQEYFVPIDQFTDFLQGLKQILLEEKANAVNITVRYVPQNSEAMLSYAQEDMLALVILFNHRLDEKSVGHMEKTTQRLVDLAIAHDATYYLTYQLFPEKDQLRQVYPDIEQFFALKRKYDPQELFLNQFYARYGKDGS